MLPTLEGSVALTGAGLIQPDSIGSSRGELRAAFVCLSWQYSAVSSQSWELSCRSLPTAPAGQLTSGLDKAPAPTSDPEACGRELFGAGGRWLRPRLASQQIAAVRSELSELARAYSRQSSSSEAVESRVGFA